MEQLQSSGIEKRKVERFDIALPAQLIVSGNDVNSSLDMETINICEGGAFFNTNQALPIGTYVDINLRLPFNKKRGTQLKLKGSVIRIEESGMAVRFDKKCEYSICGNA